MRYKIGDKVRSVKYPQSPAPKLSPGGEIGYVMNIEPTAQLPYMVKTEKGIRYYSEDALEPFVEKTYTQGLADAWELANKLSALNSAEFDKVFGCVNFVDVFCNYTAEEALAKIEACEMEKEARVFRVGDEVTFLDQYDRPMKGCVVGFFTEKLLYVADKNGDIDERGKDKLTKTGVHYDEIESVFKCLDDDYER